MHLLTKKELEELNKNITQLSKTGLSLKEAAERLTQTHQEKKEDDMPSIDYQKP